MTDAPHGSSMRPSSDRLAHLESKFRTLAGRVDDHEKRFSVQEQWNAEAQKRVNKLETVTGGSPQRQCPECRELRYDSPESFPGYLEPAARGDQAEYHAWRQLCVVCRDGRQAPEDG